ncbi:MAG: helix-turn-helix transcriptional regulator [Deltaproteobacteria bacterium]|jgi:transcriptional regulator with XRE-family HTH domain|nr:helix-turn-helix transcriptional regulator [Deltaproteobacteria bacterium]
MEMKKEIKLSQVLQRELKGKVISRVAKEIGISVSILHDWYSSSRKPSAKNMWHLKKLADYLGLTLEQILFDEKSEKQTISSTTFSDRGVQYRINIEKVKG